jgi:hypothetical protein
MARCLGGMMEDPADFAEALKSIAFYDVGQFGKTWARQVGTPGRATAAISCSCSALTAIGHLAELARWILAASAPRSTPRLRGENAAPDDSRRVYSARARILTALVRRITIPPAILLRADEVIE